MLIKTMLILSTSLALFCAVPTGAFAHGGGGHSGSHLFGGSHFGDGFRQDRNRYDFVPDYHGTDGLWPNDPLGYDQSCYQTDLYPRARDRHAWSLNGCYN